MSVLLLFYSLGVLPHVPRMLPVFISDPELRAKAAETFNSEEFQDNIENYFVENIKVTKMLLPPDFDGLLSPSPPRQYSVKSILGVTAGSGEGKKERKPSPFPTRL